MWIEKRRLKIELQALLQLVVEKRIATLTEKVWPKTREKSKRG